MTYAARLKLACGDSPAGLCLGIDPAPEALQLLAPARLVGTDRSARAQAIERFGCTLVEAAAGHAAAVKPQLAWFEHAGHEGIRALERIVEDARAAGLIVVLDGKRGDIPHSARVYAQAWLGEDAASGIRGDALTVNGWIGPDSMRAIAEVAHERDCQAYVLVLTSNPESGTFQLMTDGDGDAWWLRVARVVEELGLGAVIGASRPTQLVDAARHLPSAPLLIPGIGAQGGSASDLLPLIRRATPDAAPLLVNIARSALPSTPMPAGDLIACTRQNLDSLQQQIDQLSSPSLDTLGSLR